MAVDYLLEPCDLASLLSTTKVHALFSPPLSPFPKWMGLVCGWQQMYDSIRAGLGELLLPLPVFLVTCRMAGERTGIVEAEAVGPGLQSPSSPVPPPLFI